MKVLAFPLNSFFFEDFSDFYQPLPNPSSRKIISIHSTSDRNRKYHKESQQKVTDASSLRLNVFERESPWRPTEVNARLLWNWWGLLLVGERKILQSRKLEMLLTFYFCSNQGLSISNSSRDCADKRFCNKTIGELSILRTSIVSITLNSVDWSYQRFFRKIEISFGKASKYLEKLKHQEMLHSNFEKRKNRLSFSESNLFPSHWPIPGLFLSSVLNKRKLL